MAIPFNFHSSVYANNELRSANIKRLFLYVCLLVYGGWLTLKSLFLDSTNIKGGNHLLNVKVIFKIYHTKSLYLVTTKIPEKKLRNFTC